MNIERGLLGVFLLLTVMNYHADAAAVCVDRNAAMEIADLNQQVTFLLVNGEGEKAAPYEQRAARLARTHCVIIDTYPPQRTNNPTKRGCRIFSGEARLSGGDLKTVYWTLCPQANE